MPTTGQCKFHSLPAAYEGFSGYYAHENRMTGQIFHYPPD